MTDPRPIGLFDSGVGGLTVLRELQKTFPHENFLYLGDSARAPYGSKSGATVARYTNECVGFLHQRKVKAIVVACNTASSVGLKGINVHLPYPVIDTIGPSALCAAEVSRSGKIAILGTRATIQSKAYEYAISVHRSEAQYVTQACPLFVPCAEEGLVSGPVIESVVAHYFNGFDWSEIDTVILACTHYPLLRSAIVDALGPRIQCIDSAAPIAHALSKLFLDETITRNSSCEPGRTHYFVTDDVARFNKIGQHFLGGKEINAALAVLEN